MKASVASLLSLPTRLSAAEVNAMPPPS